MPRLAYPNDRFVQILDACPPGDYLMLDIAHRIGVTYTTVQILFKNHRHPRMVLTDGPHPKAAKTVTIKPGRWSTRPGLPSGQTLRSTVKPRLRSRPGDPFVEQ